MTARPRTFAVALVAALTLALLAAPHSRAGAAADRPDAARVVTRAADANVHQRVHPRQDGVGGPTRCWAALPSRVGAGYAAAVSGALVERSPRAVAGATSRRPSTRAPPR